MPRSLTVVIFALTCAACSNGPQPPSLVTGPFGGTTHRFYVDSLTLPQPMQLMADYGDGRGHDQLGYIDAFAAARVLQSQSTESQLKAGSLLMRVELTSEDALLRNDPTVGVRFDGAGTAGDLLGATLRDGVLHTNRIHDLRAPSFATVALPLFADADPVEWPLEALELDLNSDGNGGFNGELHATAELTATHDDIIAAAYQPFLQMVTARPDQRAWVIHNFDVDRDGMISRAELAGNDWVKLAVRADVLLHDAAGKFAPHTRLADDRDGDAITLGLGFHLTPCHDDACTPPPTLPSCDDRLKNGGETAVDCGGPCQPCAAGLACANDHDCSSGSCAGGICAAPSCSDGRRDGFEIDVDCGPGCTLCAPGQRCFDDSDCMSGTCHNGACSAQIQTSATVVRSAAK
jgi:hypothetical protein